MSMDIFKTDENGALKEYQTLFWVPMLFQTNKQAEGLIEEMLDMIQDFHDTNQKTSMSSRRASMMKKGPAAGPPKRRQQIFGEAMDPEPANVTKMDVIMKSETTRLNLLTVLRRHFLFSQLRDSELDDVVDVMQLYNASEGDYIIRQGDHGETFYILEEGTVELWKDSTSWGLIEAGNSFGDLALMYNSPRAASIVAKTYCTLWTLDRVFFRQAMVTSSSNQNVQLSQFLQKITLFKSIGVQQLNQLARSLSKQSYEDGSYIIKQGDVGDNFFVVYRGRVVVSKTDDSGNENDIVKLGEGEVFGELALIKKEPRKANVRALGPVECYYLESHDFHLMLGDFVEQFNKMNEFRIIRLAEVLLRLSKARLEEFIGHFSTQRVYSGQRVVCATDTIYIVLEGQFVSSNNERFGGDDKVEVGSLEATADVCAGALSVVTDEGLLASFTKEQLLEFLKKQDEDEARQARRMSYMDARSRSMMEGGGSNGGSMQHNVNDVHSPGGPGAGGASGSGNGGGSGGDSAQREIQLTAERRRASAVARRAAHAELANCDLSDLEVVQALGKGTFGTVFLCTHRPSGEKLALKCLDKRAIVEGGQHVYVRREIVALSSFSHPFLGGYYGVLLSRSKVCFMLEYIAGVELWSYLYDENIVAQTTMQMMAATGKDLNNSQQISARGEHGGIHLDDANLYAANLLLALEHIHGLGYTYRDLKPENLMIHAPSGYLKLIDFGFAKQIPFVKNGQIQYRSFTLCGTPDYMAPELVLSQGHDKSVDYWAYGCLLYELICGHTPFEATSQQRTFEKIVHSQKYLNFPPAFDPHCKSLIRRLLHPNAALRLGSLQNGIDDIKTHAFFAMSGIVFDDLLQQKYTMPYIPPLDVASSASISSGQIDFLDVDFELSRPEDDPADEEKEEEDPEGYEEDDVEEDEEGAAEYRTQQQQHRQQQRQQRQQQKQWIEDLDAYFTRLDDPDYIVDG